MGKSWVLCLVLLSLGMGLHMWFFRASQQLSLPRPTVPADRGDVQELLVCSERSWKRKNDLLWLREKKMGLREGKFPAVEPGKGADGSLFWSYFQPNFPCPLDVERVGRAGDAGWDVCGFPELGGLGTVNCSVYSMGIQPRLSFERRVLEGTSCSLRIFHLAPMPSAVLQLRQDFPGRLTYTQGGIGPDRNSLKALMSRMKDSVVQVLKMDVQGAEWLGLEEAGADFPYALPVGQLLLELHMHWDRAHAYPALRQLFNLLQNRGLRAFGRQATSAGPFRYSFLSVKEGFFTIHKPPF